MLLAFDACSDAAQLALVSGDSVVAQAEHKIERGRSDALIGWIDALLAGARVQYSELKGVIVVNGPGSFTGVRVGVAAARAIGLARQTPITAVNGFEILAGGLQSFQGRCAIVFGRGARLSWRVYERSVGLGVRPMGEMRVGAADSLLSLDVDIFKGPGALYLDDPRAQHCGFDILEAARIGAFKLREGRLPPPSPLYLRAPDAAPSSYRPPEVLDGPL